MRQINAAGLALIKEFEGCKLVAYRDQKGILTIGTGHTGEHVTEGLMISQHKADELLQEDLHDKEEKLDAMLPRSLNENQFSALVCFAFNCGVEALHSSTLFKYLEHGYITQAADEFLKWDKINIRGKYIPDPGLLRRRRAERELFLKPVAALA
jgi:lysozyme